MGNSTHYLYGGIFVIINTLFLQKNALCPNVVLIKMERSDNIILSLLFSMIGLWVMAP